MNKNQLEKLMSVYCETGQVPEDLKPFACKDIGQGLGYKLDKPWHLIKDDEVCYIPECAYKRDDGSLVDYPIRDEDIYIKKDFVGLVGKGRAQQLFEDVDWQSPNLLAFEYDWKADYNDRYTVNHEPGQDYYYIWDNLENEVYGDVFGNPYHFDDYEDALQECEELNYEQRNA